MIALLLALAWITQGIPVAPAATGVVTGTLKTELGTPAAGVRVAAMARPETTAEISSATALASIAETDENGRYRLENIPQGRYFIIAGRVDFPTFYPGTQDVTAGLVLTVKPGDVISGRDFVLNSIAARPPNTRSAFGISSSPALNLPIVVNVEGSGKIPVFSEAGFTSLRLTRTTDGLATSMPLTTPSVSVAIQTGAAPEYRIALDNLPAGYSVGSILYGKTVITNATLKLSTSSIPSTGTIFSAGSPPLAGSLVVGPNIVALQAGVPALTITLVVDPASGTSAAGVRVSGSAPYAETRSIYLSGVPGIFYADGSFEFRGVKPGRYSLSTPDNPFSSRPLAASVVVGNRDVAGIELSATPLLPFGILTPAAAAPVGTHNPGFTSPEGIIRGIVLDEGTREPITEGTVYLTGHYGASRSLVPDGRFEFSRLLPGSYKMEVQTFGHATIQKTIVVEEADVDLVLGAPPAN